MASTRVESVGVAVAVEVAVIVGVNVPVTVGVGVAVAGGDAVSVAVAVGKTTRVGRLNAGGCLTSSARYRAVLHVTKLNTIKLSKNRRMTHLLPFFSSQSSRNGVSHRRQT